MTAKESSSIEIRNNVEPKSYYLVSNPLTISQTMVRRMRGMWSWWKDNDALRLRNSANVQVNTPQSEPFNCWGISYKRKLWFKKATFTSTFVYVKFLPIAFFFCLNTKSISVAFRHANISELLKVHRNLSAKTRCIANKKVPPLWVSVTVK